jgi:glutathione S-transferase
VTDELLLFHNPMSRARIAHWMLEEAGARYGVRLLDLQKAEHKSPEFLAVNPMGKLPALLHGDTVVTETAAICAYVADLFPARGLAPSTQDRARGTYLRWMFFAAACVEPAITDRMMTRPDVERRSALGYGSYEDVFRTLRGVLEPGGFLLGEDFSAADLYLGSQLAFGTQVGVVEPSPWITDYVMRCQDRPSFKRAETQGAAMIQQLKGLP